MLHYHQQMNTFVYVRRLVNFKAENRNKWNGTGIEVAEGQRKEVNPESPRIFSLGSVQNVHRIIEKAIEKMIEMFKRRCYYEQ